MYIYRRINTHIGMRQIILFFVCIGGAGMFALGATTTDSMVPGIIGLVIFYGYIFYIFNKVFNNSKKKERALEAQREREQRIIDIERRREFDEAYKRLMRLVDQYDKRDDIR